MKVTSIVISIVLTLSIVSIPAAAQKAADDIRENIRLARQEIAESKAQSVTSAATTPVPSDFADPDSFGKNAKFLGSLYAGTVYVYRSCDPTILLDELGLILAADDKCIAIPTSQVIPSTEFFDPAWQITIPGRTVDNVIYPMLNHTVGYNILNPSVGGTFTTTYSPIVTIESAALNDPTALDPRTGAPLNGSFKTSLSGAQGRGADITTGGFISESVSYASVSGRGLSRSYFASIGLPQNVINNLFKQPMTLKFGIRVRYRGPITDAFSFYTVRLLGN